MENTTHVLILKDGTQIQATLNGNNYITSQNINMETLTEENLQSFSIDGAEYEDHICTNCWPDQDDVRFIIRPLTTNEKMFRSMNAMIDYVAMMADVDIPEEE